MSRAERLSAFALLAGLSAVAAAHAQTPRANPLAAASTLPFHAPRFDLIQDSDYQPAIDAGMATQLAEIRRIADNPAMPTFENTVVAIEVSGRMLDRAGSTFSAGVQANTNPVLDKVQAFEAPRLAAHQDAIFLDPKLFARVKAVYDARATLRLDPEKLRLLDVSYRSLVHAGAQLAPSDQTRLRALNGRISTLETAFQQKLLAAAKAGALVIDDRAKLAGLDEAAIAAAATAAKERGLTGKWLLTLQNTTQQPLLESLSNRATREALFNASWTRAVKGDANDTRATIAELAQLRAEKAALFGYPSFAAYTLYDQMAKTPIES